MYTHIVFGIMGFLGMKKHQPLRYMPSCGGEDEENCNDRYLCKNDYNNTLTKN